MSPFRYHDEDSSTGIIVGVVAGAVAGFAAGMLVAQRVGGFSGLTERIRHSSVRNLLGSAEWEDETLDEYDEDEIVGDEDIDTLEGRVLEAFQNDPILSERPVDIGSIGDGIIELAGSVDTEEEAEHAVTIARGVPDVVTVVNRLTVGDEEALYEETAQRVADGDPSLTETHWEGRTVGTGRRRQGNSSEVDRHEDPKVALESRWASTHAALENAADEIDGLAERRSTSKKSPRSAGTVPRADHVSTPSTDDTTA